MNIDQRLEALTERVEALTHSVELIGSFHQDLAKKFDETTKKLEENIINMSSLLTLLTKAVANHEHRLDDIEGSGNLQ